MSLAIALTKRSICIRLSLGMLSLTFFTPGSSAGAGWRSDCCSAADSSRSISRTKVSCSSSKWRSAAPIVDRTLLRSTAMSSEHALEALAILHAAVELFEHLVRLSIGASGLFGPA